jgi:uncharacterized YccA/Bax inhibitor family protein
MRTSNPVLRSDTFVMPNATGASMTIGGTVSKTSFLLGLALITTFATYSASRRGIDVRAWMWAGAIGGLILAVITAFKPRWAAVTGSLYALAEGVFLGGISAQFDARFPGIALAAAGCTLGTLAALLIAYQSRLIPVTQNFRLGVFAATGGIALFYVVCMVLQMFNVQVPYIHQSGWIGIGFSVFVVIIAAMNLVLDFDFIERGAESGAPRYMEWYAAFGLLVTLVWLYLEILRLLAKIMGRRD